MSTKKLYGALIKNKKQKTSISSSSSTENSQRQMALNLLAADDDLNNSDEDHDSDTVNDFQSPQNQYDKTLCERIENIISTFNITTVLRYLF